MDDGISPLSISDVDTLLDELASHSTFSHQSVHDKFPPDRRRKREVIIHALFHSLSPEDASVLTQIILKDLSPLLYPVPDHHYTVALRGYNSAAVKELTVGDFMRAWDQSRVLVQMYHARSMVVDAVELFEKGVRDTLPCIGIPIEVSSWLCRRWSGPC